MKSELSEMLRIFGKTGRPEVERISRMIQRREKGIIQHGKSYPCRTYRLGTINQCVGILRRNATNYQHVKCNDAQRFKYNMQRI